MANLRIIDRGIDVRAMLREIHPRHWLADTGRQRTVKVQRETQSIHLVRGRTDDYTHINDSEFFEPTEFWSMYTNTRQWLQQRFPKGLSRIMLVKLPAGHKVYEHIDLGEYYRRRDRYHLVLQGRYTYWVGSQSMRVGTGTLFWFDNKLPHHTLNHGDVDRISLIFDVANPASGH